MINAVLEAVRVGQAEEPSATPTRRALQQDRCRRASWLIGIDPGFCSWWNAVARY
jgi:hypothetical protein